MQRSIPGRPSFVARLVAHCGALPLGGFAAPPPILLTATQAADRPPPSAERRRPAVDVQRPVRWTSLSALR